MVTIRPLADLPPLKKSQVVNNLRTYTEILQAAVNEARSGKMTAKQLADRCEQIAGDLVDSIAILRKEYGESS